MAGIERADSIVLDPHKGLFLPYGTGCLLVRDAATLRRAHAAGAEYLPGMQSDPDFVDFCEISPELSRAFRGLARLAPAQDARPRPVPPEPRREARPRAVRGRASCAASRTSRSSRRPQLSLLAFRFAPKGRRGSPRSRP